MNFIKERTKALNENTLEAFKKYCIKVGDPTCVLTSEEAWLRAWRKCQYNDRSCYPKIRKEAKEWLTWFNDKNLLNGGEIKWTLTRSFSA